ncbi:MAG TPA: hypothetical protein VKV80_04750 [Streptosporangiaceae bacterium]|nr:hypothetical protein [Streptosporangiaceae bacterium]
MRDLLMAGPAPAVNLDQPGTYLHWPVFTVSEANLVLTAVMVVSSARRSCCRSPGTAAAATAVRRPRRRQRVLGSPQTPTPGIAQNR